MFFHGSRQTLYFIFLLVSFLSCVHVQLTELKKEKNPFARGVKHHDSETEARIVLHNQQQSLHHPHGMMFYTYLSWSYVCRNVHGVMS